MKKQVKLHFITPCIACRLFNDLIILKALFSFDMQHPDNENICKFINFAI